MGKIFPIFSKHKNKIASNIDEDIKQPIYNENVLEENTSEKKKAEAIISEHIELEQLIKRQKELEEQSIDRERELKEIRVAISIKTVEEMRESKVLLRELADELKEYKEQRDILDPSATPPENGDLKIERNKYIDNYLSKPIIDKVSERIKIDLLNTLANLSPDKKKELESITLALQLDAVISDADEAAASEAYKEKQIRRYKEMQQLEGVLEKYTVVDIKNLWWRINELEVRIPRILLQLNNKGVTLLNARKYKDALKYFDDITKINPKLKLKSVWLNKGTAMGGTGNYKEAINCYDKALEIDPDYALALYWKGVTLKKDGNKLSEAEQLLEKAYTIDPKLRKQKGGFH